jgi:hypothetical protein
MARLTNIQHRRDTAANWTSVNPTLDSGELGFETDTFKFKIGNGSTAWNSLAYQNTTGAQGTVGTQGATGSQGTTGTQGITGLQGIQGQSIQGIQGTTGASGLTTSSTTISANTATTVDTLALSSFTTAKYVVSIKQGSKIRSSEVIVQTDGTSVDYTEYVIVETGGIMTGIDVAGIVSSSNMVLNITITDASSTNATVKIQKVLL